VIWSAVFGTVLAGALGEGLAVALPDADGAAAVAVAAPKSDPTYKVTVLTVSSGTSVEPGMAAERVLACFSRDAG
jgi:hypothetical protein